MLKYEFYIEGVFTLRRIQLYTFWCYLQVFNIRISVFTVFLQIFESVECINASPGTLTLKVKVIYINYAFSINLLQKVIEKEIIYAMDCIKLNENFGTFLVNCLQFTEEMSESKVHVHSDTLDLILGWYIISK